MVIWMVISPPVQSMTTQENEDLKFQSFLTSALDGSEWLFGHSVTKPRTNRTGRYVRPRASLGGLGKRWISCPFWKWKGVLLAVHLVYRHTPTDESRLEYYYCYYYYPCVTFAQDIYNVYLKQFMFLGCLQFVLHAMLIRPWNMVCPFTPPISAISVQYPVRQFFAVSLVHAFRYVAQVLSEWPWNSSSCPYYYW